jgi:sulfite reductase alpha subunit-like flavoprotein
MKNFVGRRKKWLAEWRVLGQQKFVAEAKATNSILWGMSLLFLFLWFKDSTESLIRIDGALDPWMDRLLEALLTMYPLPAGVDMVPNDRLPPARVSMVDTSTNTLEDLFDPLEEDPNYHIATVKYNERITAEKWYQDVRHLEFDLEDDIQYVSI